MFVLGLIIGNFMGMILAALLSANDINKED